MTDTIVLEKLPVTAGVSAEYPKNFKSQRLYIFATRQGLVFSGLLIVMLFSAIQYSNSLAYLLTFLLSSLTMVCILHTYRNLRGIVIKTLSVEPVFAGKILRIPLLFDNRYGHKRLAVNIEIAQSRKSKKSGEILEIEPLVVNLNAGKTGREYLSAISRHRGCYRLGRLKISSGFPLGLFKTWAYLSSNQLCVVYPKPEGSVQLPVFTDYDAEESSGKETGTDDFTGFKPYRPGDPIRNINWKAFAKQQPLTVKRFSGSGSRRLLISWNQCAHLHDEERRLSQLCLWLLEAEKEGFLYGLEMPEEKIDLGNGDIHLNKCLLILARHGFKDT